jgi:diguanylate cyclase (GGDEF)-like protein/PAS domain S-box-containing protein
LAAVLLFRALVCHMLFRNERARQRRGAALFGAAAAIEGAAWAGGALWLAWGLAEGVGLQIALGAGVLFATLPAFATAGAPWFMHMAPLALAQAYVLLHWSHPQRDVVGLAWLLALVLTVAAAIWLRRMLAANLALRERADHAAQAQREFAKELNYSREQLRLALEAIDAGVSDTNLETGERFFSNRYVEILGFRDREAFAKSHRFSAAIHRKDRARVLEARRRHVQGRAPFHEEFRMRTAAGSYVWVEARGASVREPDGRVTRFVMSIVDISIRRRAEKRLAASEARYRALVEASPSLIWTCDGHGRLTFVSDRASRLLYGYEPREMIGRHVSAFTAPGFSRREFLRRFAAAFRGRPIFDVELTQQAKGGRALNVVVSALPTTDERGTVEAVFGVCSDVTALKQRERELNLALRRQQAIFDAAGEGIAFVRGDRIEGANRALAKMLGVTRESLLGRPVSGFLAEEQTWETVRAATAAASAHGNAAIHEVPMRATGSGPGVWCQLTSRQTESYGDGDTMILVLTDITVLKRREELAWHQANHDELTGLPNRRLLVEHARRLLSVALRQKRLAAVMVLDLDGFKDVFDAFGHAFGDGLLRRVALRLSSVLRDYDLVARTGGDEFVVLLPEIEQPAVAIVVAEKLIAAASETLEAPDRSLRIAASVGVALFPSDGHEFDALLTRADAAMYAAKASGKNRFCLASEAAADSGKSRQPESLSPYERSV